MAGAQTFQNHLRSIVNKPIWKNIRFYCCYSRKDARIFWYCYAFVLIILFIIFMIAFLRKPSVAINYLRWYNDSCSTDFITTSPIIECDRTLRLYCSTVTNQCACLNNMFWNGSFCDCTIGMYYTDNHCQERLVFGQMCNSQSDSCMEYLTCSKNTHQCDCPFDSYYNQTTCNPKLPYNALQPCTLASQCVSGLVCRSNVCTCLSGQSWNGNMCTNSSTHGQYCITNSDCDSSALLMCNTTNSKCVCNPNSFWNGQICHSRLNNGSFCNNTQQCYSNLICINNYCHCPLVNTQYWSSQTSTCELCFGENLFLYDGICYYIPLPTNATFGTYTVLSSIYNLPTIEYDYQMTYLLIQNARVFNWTSIFFATSNPIVNYFQWSSENSLIKPNYLCNGTVTSNYVGYTLSLKLETYASCLRALPSSTTGQLVYQLNRYVYHVR
ncbi:unnamed protein product [Adineta ricciae]|uniref:EGF-like domain-containing protein n=1 Tax=Adineta ricciae TaxID=249248 RepID=A0A813RA00_ADIRI|nr:unnamed protein product [Adineta ricciae]CAF0804817.1 unnamed protein product [Adineta ricciae]